MQDRDNMTIGFQMVKLEFLYNMLHLENSGPSMGKWGDE